MVELIVACAVALVGLRFASQAVPDPVARLLRSHVQPLAALALVALLVASGPIGWAVLAAGGFAWFAYVHREAGRAAREAWAKQAAGARHHVRRRVQPSPSVVPPAPPKGAPTGGGGP